MPREKRGNHRPTRGPGKIIAVGGAKGGIGKSLFVANLGVLLSQLGKKTVLVDLDLGASNLHLYMGIWSLPHRIDEFLSKKVNRLDHIIAPTIIPNLFIITSINCSMEIANLFYAQKMKIIRAIQRLSYDYIFIDLGAGTNFNTLDFFLTSNKGLFIVTPEPTSIENTFRFIKAVYLRIIKKTLKQNNFNSIVREVDEDPQNASMKAASDIIEMIIRHDPDKRKFFRDKLSRFKFLFILNQFRKQIDKTLGEKIEKVCNKHFYSEFQFLGNINYDEKVHDSIFSKKIFIENYPYTMSAVNLQDIAKKITGNGDGSILQSLHIS